MQNQTYRMDPAKPGQALRQPVTAEMPSPINSEAARAATHAVVDFAFDSDSLCIAETVFGPQEVTLYVFVPEDQEPEAYAGRVQQQLVEVVKQATATPPPL